jgi:hypothetical protein
MGKMEHHVEFEVWTSSAGIRDIFMENLWACLGDLFCRVEYLSETLKISAKSGRLDNEILYELQETLRVAIELKRELEARGLHGE